MSTVDPHADRRATLYNATLTGERIHHGNVMVIRVRPDQEIVSPKPGQWIELGLGVWERVREGAEAGRSDRLPPGSLIRRAYSISSPILDPDRDRLVGEDDLDGFEFFLSLVVPPEERAARVPNLTGRLFCLKTGDRLFMADRPMGEYTLAPVKHGMNVLFVATGTGEAPHNAMIWELLRSAHAGRIASIVSVRHADDLAYDGVHKRLVKLFPHYRYQAVVTRGEGALGKHLQDMLVDGSLERMADFPLDPSNTQVFLCGNPGMIGPPRYIAGRREFPREKGMVELLEDLGFNADRRLPPVDVHYERYW
jgi:ferredoxin--NADP+ reductase